MREFVFYSPKIDGEILFTYNDEGYLCKYVLKTKLAIKQFEWLTTKFPFTLEQLAELKAFKDIKIKEVEPDLSFERFWKEYGNKKGKLKMTENTWNRLSKADKTRIFAHIPVYRQQCYNDGVQMAYPSTYLNQEYWKY